MDHEQSEEKINKQCQRTTVERFDARPISLINITLFRYVPLYYTNGDECELTKMPRTVEVKLR